METLILFAIWNGTHNIPLYIEPNYEPSVENMIKFLECYDFDLGTVIGPHTFCIDPGEAGPLETTFTPTTGWIEEIAE